MHYSILFRRISKSLFVFITLALLGGYAVHDAVSRYNGGLLIAGYAELGGCGVGSQCHSAFADTTTVIHLYMPAKIFAGKTYQFTVSVSNTNPEDVAAGFDVDVDTPVVLDTIAGMNTIAISPDTSFSTEWSITHSIPQWFYVNGANSDSAVWSFLYTAPSVPGTYPIYVAGNAVNGDSALANDSDRWNDITVNITVLAPDGVAPASPVSSVQVYPNPASNELFINDGIPSDVGSYALTDPAGRIVLSGRETPLDGNHSVDISSVSMGAYILSIETRDGHSFVRRIVVQR
jgi:hypothetical protein